MFSGFGRKPIAQQLVVITLAALIAVFSILALVVQRNSDHAALTVAEKKSCKSKIVANRNPSFF